MDLETFLYLGEKLNEAGKDDLALLRMNIDREEGSSERQYLLNALETKQKIRYCYYTEAEKEQLLALAKKWNALKPEARAKVKDVLAGQSPLEDLGTGRGAMISFYELLCQNLDSTSPRTLAEGLLRVQEATEQFLIDSHGNKRPVSRWSERDSVRTFWR